MLASLLIVFREVLEAGLIVGIILAAMRDVPGRLRWVGGAVCVGVAGACLLALFTGAIADAVNGAGEEVLNAAILLLAAAMLSWHVLWMSRHGRETARQMREAGRAAAQDRGRMMALCVAVAVAVLREGAEVVLFLYGIALSDTDAISLLLGGVLGLAAGGAVAFLLYRGLLAIPVGQMFAATNGLVSLIAAGMAGGAAALLATIGALPTLGDRVWDSSGVLPETSILGKTLHALVGYSDHPMGVQLIVFALVLGGLALAGRRLSRAAPAPSGRPAHT